MQLHVFFVTFVTFVAVSLPYNAMKINVIIQAFGLWLSALGLWLSALSPSRKTRPFARRTLERP